MSKKRMQPLKKSRGFRAGIMSTAVETFRPEYWDANVEATVNRAKETATAVLAHVFGNRS